VSASLYPFNEKWSVFVLMILTIKYLIGYILIKTGFSLKSLLRLKHLGRFREI
jgi:hypothetical protein